MNPQKIYYRKVRDLGAIFGATFSFIKQNFKTFFGSLILVAGTFLVASVTISSSMFGSMFGANLFKKGFSFLTGNLVFTYFISLFLLIIGIVIYSTILNKNLIENEKLANDEKITLKIVLANFFNDFWRMLGNVFLFILISIVAIAAIALIGAGIGALFTGMSSLGTGMSIFFIIILFLVVMALFVIFVPILSYIPIAALFVCQRNRINIFAAIRKVFFYLKGNFWRTWLVSFIALLCYSIMGGIAQIPVLIVTLITTFSRVKSTVGYGAGEESTPMLLIIVTVVCSLLSYCVMSIFYLMSIYQYTSLEEKKEGTYIIDKINQIQ